jgi:thiol-disulfide isomerase/thioredoxin
MVSARHERIIRAPEWGTGPWLNTPHPIRLHSLRGRVVLVDIWEYTCINCLRTLPYLRQWHQRYATKGLTIIGVHCPEFPFGRERGQIEQAIREQEITWPVLMDNDFTTWEAYANRYWPAKYLIDGDGYIRHQSHGEGGYATFEQAIQTLLREVDADVTLPPVMQPLRAEDQPGAVCYRPTPELHAGLDRGALGNPQGYAGGMTMLYTLPPPQEQQAGAIYAEGAWQAGMQWLQFVGSTTGLLQVPYEAVDVNAVLTPHVDAVERLIHPEPVAVEIWQDGAPLTDANRGEDVTVDGRLLLDRPRMYHLVRNPGFEAHTLTLRIRTKGAAAFSFSFTGCVKPNRGS